MNHFLPSRARHFHTAMAFVAKLKQFGKSIVAFILTKPPRATVIPVVPPVAGQNNFPAQPGLQQPPRAHFPWFRRTFNAVRSHADIELTALRLGNINYTAVGGQRKQYPLAQAVEYWFPRAAAVCCLLLGIPSLVLFIWARIKTGVWFS